jgi:hypothetical protein
MVFFTRSDDRTADVTVRVLFVATLVITLASYYRGWPTHIVSPVAMLIGLVIFRVIVRKPISTAVGIRKRLSRALHMVVVHSQMR